MKSPIWRRRQAAWEAVAAGGHGGTHSGAVTTSGVLPVRSAQRQSVRRARRAIRHALTGALIAVALAAGYAVGVADDEEQLNPFAPDPVVVWAGESFYSKREFVGWLAERGIDEKHWLEQHPAVAAKLDAEPGSR